MWVGGGLFCFSSSVGNADEGLFLILTICQHILIETTTAAPTAAPATTTTTTTKDAWSHS